MLKTFISIQNRAGSMNIQITKSNDSEYIVAMGQGTNNAFSNFVADDSDSLDEENDS